MQMRMGWGDTWRKWLIWTMGRTGLVIINISLSLVPSLLSLVPSLLSLVPSLPSLVPSLLSLVPSLLSLVPFSPSIYKLPFIHYPFLSLPLPSLPLLSRPLPPPSLSLPSNVPFVWVTCQRPRVSRKTWNYLPHHWPHPLLWTCVN